MTFDLTALCLQRPDTNIVNEGYPIVEIDGFLAADDYAELLASYPDPRQDGVNHSMKN